MRLRVGFGSSLLCLLASSGAFAAPVVTMTPAGKKAVKIEIRDGYYGGLVYTGSGASARMAKEGSYQLLSLTVPLAVAKEVARAGVEGLRVFSAQDYLTGPQLRLVAGQGAGTVILDRTQRAGGNGQNSYGAMRVQRGLGENATAFFFGRARQGENLGQGRFTRSTSKNTRRGTSTIVDPATLETLTAALLDGHTPQWYVKPTRALTTVPTAPLEAFGGFMGLGDQDQDHGRGERTGMALPVINEKATLEIAPALRAVFGL